MAPQDQVYALPGTTQPTSPSPTDSYPRHSRAVTGTNQNFNMTAWMIGQSDPGTYGQLDVYQTPEGTAGPANADAEISANKTVSSDISLLDQKGSEVLLGETLMVPIADSMVYRRPLYVASMTNPQLTCSTRRGLGEERADRFLAFVRELRRAPCDRGCSERERELFDRNGPGGGVGYLSAAQTDYANALAA